MGKAKSGSKLAKAQQGSAGSGKLGSDSRPLAQKPAPAPAETLHSRIAVGAELEVKADYLDMQDVPDCGELSNSGYLVVRRGELVQILYVGSDLTDDPGWVYSEVLRRVTNAPVGTRGWMPMSALTASPRTPAAPPPPPPQAHDSSGRSSRTGGPRVDAAASNGPGPPNARGATRKPSVGTGAGGTASTKATINAQSAAAIARHRASAASAAASAGRSRPDSAELDRSCPICTTDYSPQCRLVRRPCCGGHLCVDCAGKSLNSGRCFFCREGKEEYPSLAAAARAKG